MTLRSHKASTEELHRLKTVERKKAADALAEARAHGDLSENAEYEAAKDAQGLLEAKVRLLESRLSTAQVIDVSTLSGDKVLFGATVTFEDIDSGESKTVIDNTTLLLNTLKKNLSSKVVLLITVLLSPLCFCNLSFLASLKTCCCCWLSLACKCASLGW